MKSMHNDYMIMQVNYGSCSQPLYYRMEEQSVGSLLVVFLTTWMTVDWVSLAITRRTHFYPPWAVGLVATGVTFAVWALKPLQGLSQLGLFLS